MTKKNLNFKDWLPIHRDFILPLQQARAILIKEEFDEKQLIICQKKLEGVISAFEVIQKKCDKHLETMSIEQLDDVLKKFTPDMEEVIILPEVIQIRESNEYQNHLSLYFNYALERGHSIFQLYDVLF